LKTLPEPPSNYGRYINYLDPAEVIDPEQQHEFKRLLDRRGRPPKLAYLIEWDTVKRQFSWEWKTNLNKSAEYMIDRVDMWKAAGSPESFIPWHQKLHSGATASSSQRCFLEAFQAAMFFLGSPGQVTTTMWEAFLSQHPRDLTGGARKQDQVDFYRFARNHGVRFDYKQAIPNKINQSVSCLPVFKKFVEKLAPGWFVVHAGDDEDEHCFALHVDSSGVLTIVDKFDEAQDPPGKIEPVDNLQWIDKIYSIRSIVPTSTPYKVHRRRKKVRVA